MKNKNQLMAIVLAVALVSAIVLIQFNPLSQQDFENYLQIVIDYEDGTTQTFSPKQLPLLSQSIIDSTGKNVVGMRSELYAQVDYSGNAVSWSSAGTLKWQILDSAKNIKNSVSMAMTPVSGNTAPPKNTPFVIASSTVTASGIEGLYSGWVSGQTYYLRFEVTNLAFQINFSDGTAQSKTSSAAYEWKFVYQSSNQFTSLSVTWQATSS